MSCDTCSFHELVAYTHDEACNCDSICRINMPMTPGCAYYWKLTITPSLGVDGNVTHVQISAKDYVGYKAIGHLTQTPNGREWNLELYENTYILAYLQILLEEIQSFMKEHNLEGTILHS